MYIVMTSSAKVAGKARQYGRYRDVAVVETDGVGVPAMISERAKHVERIVRHYGAQSVGKTANCAFFRTLAEAEALAAELNRASR